MMKLTRLPDRLILRGLSFYLFLLLLLLGVSGLEAVASRRSNLRAFCLAPVSDGSVAVAGILRKQIEHKQVVHVKLTYYDESFYGNQSKVVKTALSLAEKLGERYEVVLVYTEEEERFELERFVGGARHSDNFHFMSFSDMSAQSVFLDPDHIVLVGDGPTSDYLSLVSRKNLKRVHWIGIYGITDEDSRIFTRKFDRTYESITTPLNYIKTGWYPDSRGMITEPEDTHVDRLKLSVSAAGLEDEKKRMLKNILADVSRIDEQVLSVIAKRRWGFALVRGDRVKKAAFPVAGLPAYVLSMCMHSLNNGEPFFLTHLLHNSVRMEVEYDVIEGGLTVSVFKQIIDYLDKCSQKPFRLVLWNPRIDDKIMHSITEGLRLMLDVPEGFPLPDKDFFEYRQGNKELTVVHGALPAKLRDNMQEYSFVLLQPAVLSRYQIARMLNIMANRTSLDTGGMFTEYPVLCSGDSSFGEALWRGVVSLHDGNLGSNSFIFPHGVFDKMREFARVSNSGKETEKLIEAIEQLCFDSVFPDRMDLSTVYPDRFTEILNNPIVSGFLLAFSDWLEKNFDALEFLRREILSSPQLDAVIELSFAA